MDTGRCSGSSPALGSGAPVSFTVTNGAHLSIEGSTGMVSGVTVIGPSFAMDAATTATLGGTIRFENAGTTELMAKTITEGSSVTVSGSRTELSLESCTLDPRVSQIVHQPRQL